MDAQDGQDKALRHEDITGAILACAFEVINELGVGFVESVYEKAMMVSLLHRGCK
jgi:GxxExxY protein